MPACRQCGKQNPEGTLFCGYCAASLAPAKPMGAPSSIPPVEPSPPPSIAKHEIRQSAPPKIFKPEIKVQPGPAGNISGRGGIELLPWNKLSSTQKAGRALAIIIGLFLIFFFLRGILRGIGSSSPGAPPQQAADSAAINDSDRSDGIESLCKVFQIYGLPRNEQDAAASVKNASQLSNKSPERSTFILTTVAGDFRTGKLKEDDCAQVGHPLKTAAGVSDVPAAAGDRIGAIPPPPGEGDRRISPLPGAPPANEPNSGSTR
jgi:hypothetical protein